MPQDKTSDKAQKGLKMSKFGSGTALVGNTQTGTSSASGTSSCHHHYHHHYPPKHRRTGSGKSMVHLSTTSKNGFDKKATKLLCSIAQQKILSYHQKMKQK